MSPVVSLMFGPIVAFSIATTGNAQTSDAALNTTESSASSSIIVRPSFPMTLRVFRATLNHNIRQDAAMPEASSAGVLTACTIVLNDTHLCAFNDVLFKRTLREMRQGGYSPATGSVTHLTQLIVDASIPNGQVRRIEVRGSRADPANFLDWQSAVLRVIEVVSPLALRNQGQLQHFHDEARLSRTDSDPTIGQPTSMRVGAATVTCMTTPSRVSMAVSCAITPAS